MRFIARKEEVARVLSILESDDYATGEDMAKALIVEVVDMLWFRDWWILATRGDKNVVAFGPFASEAEAKAFGQKTQGVLVPADSMRWGVVQVHGLGGTAEVRKGGGYGYCVVEGCGHPAYGHSTKGSSRGRCLLCEVCEEYEQAKAKPRARRTKEVA